MFEFSVRWFAWGIDTSLKALFVAIGAAVLMKLLRFGDSNQRHRVWTGVLVGMLLLPLLTPIVPALRFPLMPSPDSLLALTERMTDEDSASRDAAAQSLTNNSAAPLTPTLSDPPREFLSPPMQDAPRTELRPRRPPESPGLILGEAPRAVQTIAEPVLAEPIAVAKPLPSQAPITSRLIAAITIFGFSAIWICGSALLAARLAIGLWMAARLVRQSKTINAAELWQRVPNSIFGVAVRECAGIHVPLTVGCWRPQILLPSEWHAWPAEKLHAVLAHENMHVHRADCAVALLAEINCCLYWFHPLSWWLKRQLAVLAEQACDDAAVDSTGSRTIYARHLLEVAAAVSQQRGRLAPTGVSMARRSNVETRIQAILDFRRPLSRRLSWSSTCVILAVMVPLIALTAALKPSSGQQATGNADLAKKASDEPAKNVSKAVEPKPPATSDRKPADDQPPILESTFTFAGTVVDDRARPIAGVTISLGYSSNMPADETLRHLAVSDERGRFSFARKVSDLVAKDYPRAWTGAELIASKEGYGFGIGPLPYLETSGRLLADLSDRERRIAEYHCGKPSADIVLAADDVPIRGRIVNSEGQPISGATVVAADAWRGHNGKLDDWLTAAAAPGADEPTAKQHLAHYSQSGLSVVTAALSAPHALVVPSVRSDADGRFTLTGIGRERIVELYISGPGIATMTVRARSRPGDVVRMPRNPASLEERMLVYHPADFTCIATPSVPVQGRVTDRRTGEPLADLLVQGVFEAAYIHTTTDAEGQYRLEGLPLGENTLRVSPPRKSGYFVSEVQVTTALGGQPAIQDVSLSRGVVVRGRVTDTTTGKPIYGTMSYFAFINNPHLRASPGFELSDEHYSTDTDGRYEIPVLPGPGLLTFTAWPDEYFRRGVGADKIDGPKSVTNAVFFRTEPYLVTPGNVNLLSAIYPPADASEIALDLSLTSGRSLTCRLRRADGQPVGQYYLYGYQAFAGWIHGRTDETFRVHGYFPDVGRRVMVYHPEGNLVGWKDLTGETPEDFEIALEPGGKLIGRVLDADGLPLEGISIGSAWGQFNIPDRYSPAVAKTWGELPANLEGRRTLTDKSGRFELQGVIPGLEYTGAASGPRKMNGQLQTMSLGTIFNATTVEAGQTKDLGDLQIEAKKKAGEEPKSQPKEKSSDPQGNKDQPKAAPAPTAPVSSEPRGRVLGANGKAVAGAKIYWFHERIADPDPLPPRLLATTDATGEFKLTLPALQSTDPNEPYQSGSQQRLVVIAPGHGFVMSSPQELRNQATEPPGFLGSLVQSFTGSSLPIIRLPQTGEPIRGRLVNIDGQPVAGATVRVRWFDDGPSSRGPLFSRAAASGDKVWQDLANQLLRVIEPVQLRDILPQATTDTAGRFELKDLGPSRLFQLLVQGDHSESVDIVVRNQAGAAITVPPDRGHRETEFVLHPQDFVLAVGPSKPVSGRVIDLDTGEPIGGAIVRAYEIHGQRLRSSRERQEFATRTAADGSYRITGLPIGKENSLVALTLGEVPYFPGGHQIDTTKSENVQQDFRLKKGVWATGRVFDAETDQPFVGQISYYWFRNRKLEQEIPSLFRSFVDGLYFTNSKGEFRLPVLHSRGILAFNHGGTAVGNVDRFPRGGGADAIEGIVDMGGLKSFPTLPHYLIPINYERVAEVNPQVGQSTIRVDLPLFASQPVKIRVVDAEGKPLGGCEIYGGNERWGWQEKPSAEFSIEDLLPNERRKVFAFHRERNLAGGLIVKRDDAQPIEIKLAAAGSVTGRLVDKDGEPITDATLDTDYEKYESNDSVGIWADDPKLVSNPTTIPLDKKGRFQFDGLIPGWTYNAYAIAPRKLNGQITKSVIGVVFDDVRVKPGEKKELGDLRAREETDDPKEEPKEEPKADEKSAQPAAAADQTKASPSPSSMPANKPDGTPTRSFIGRLVDAAASQFKSQQTQLPKADPRTLRGRIIDVAGQPLSGVLVHAQPRGRVPLADLANPNRPPKMITGADGRFTAMLTSEEARAGLLIYCPGFGLTYLWKSADDTTEDFGDIVLQPERPIVGRLIDAEGRPIAGAKVAVQYVYKPKDQKSADEMLRAWTHSSNNVTQDSINDPILRYYLPEPATDADGRFTIQGAPAEHIFVLEITAPNVAFTSVWVVTREGFDPRPLNASKPNGYRKWPLAGPEFTHICLPDFKVTGRVTDESGQPLRGVRVNGHQGMWGGPGIPTDADGRFQFSGLPRGEEIVIEFEPKYETLLPRRVGVTARLDESHKTLDVVLKKGIMVTGRVTDAVTGQPVGGPGIRFCPLVDNEYAEQPGYDAFYRSGLREDVGADGYYSLRIIPGPGLLMLQAQGEGVKIGDQNVSVYRRARFSDEDRPHIKFTGDGEGRFLEVGQTLGSIGVEQVVKYVNFAPDAKPQQIDLQLQRGKTVEVEFVDADGQPVNDLFISGITETWPITAHLKDSRCTIYALGADRPRSVLVVHAQRGLAGAVTLTGDEKTPVRVTLAKSASLRGRAVDTERASFANKELAVHFEDEVVRELYRFLPEQKADLLTDKDGRFEMKHLIPGQRFTIHNMSFGDDYLEARLTTDQRSLAPGQNLDLGDVLLAQPK